MLFDLLYDKYLIRQFDGEGGSRRIDLLYDFSEVMVHHEIASSLRSSP
jgi:hypothetical protein